MKMEPSDTGGESQGPERRKYQRFPLEVGIHYKVNTENPATLVNIGQGGAAIHILEDLNQGNLVQLYLINRNVLVEGTIRSSLELNEGLFRTGFAFNNPQETLLEAMMESRPA